MRSLFNIPVPKKAANALEPQHAPGDGTPTPTDTNAVGVFPTPQAAVTFPAASGLITVVWKVLGQVSEPLGNNKLVPLILALIVGMLIYAQSVTPGGTRKDKVIGFSFAFLNSISLAATALGINTAVTNT